MSEPTEAAPSRLANAAGLGLGTMLMLAAAIFIGSEAISIDYCHDRGGQYLPRSGQCLEAITPRPLPPLTQRQPGMLMLGGVGLLLVAYSGWRLRRS
jgi:hypothetical protein